MSTRAGNAAGLLMHARLPDTPLPDDCLRFCPACRFQCLLGRPDLAILLDHRVAGTAILPGAAMLEMGSARCTAAKKIHDMIIGALLTHVRLQTNVARLLPSVPAAAAAPCWRMTPMPAAFASRAAPSRRLWCWRWRAQSSWTARSAPPAGKRCFAARTGSMQRSSCTCAPAQASCIGSLRAAAAMAASAAAVQPVC